MENASKALLMAGGVLLSIIIIGVVMFAYRGITSLQKEKDVGLSNAQVSKINEQIEKYTSKSVIYGSEVLSICNAIEDYSKKYPESDGYPEIQLKIKIKADGKENAQCGLSCAGRRGAFFIRGEISAVVRRYEGVFERIGAIFYLWETSLLAAF